MPDKKTPLAEAILARRRQRGWTQEHLARVSNVSVRTLQRIENAGVASLETVRDLAAALDLDADYLLSLQHPEPAGEGPPPLSQGIQVAALIDGAAAHRFSFEDPGHPRVSQVLADFGQNLKEHLEVWTELEPHHRLEAVELFGGFLRQLRELGWSAFGTATTELYGGPGGVRVKVANVRVLPAAAPRATAVVH
jgi:transcriptional regulator with XRE-family HTH domain